MTRPQTSLPQKLDLLLKQAIDFAGAEKGIVQVYNEDTEVLSVVSSYKIGQGFLNIFKAVRAFDPTAYGRCFGLKISIAVDDVLLDKAFFQYKHVIDQEHIRAAISLPLCLEDTKKIVGVLSIYFPKQLHLIENPGEIPTKHLADIALLADEFRKEHASGL